MTNEPEADSPTFSNSSLPSSTRPSSIGPGAGTQQKQTGATQRKQVARVSDPCSKAQPDDPWSFRQDRSGLLSVLFPEGLQRF